MSILSNVAQKQALEDMEKLRRKFYGLSDDYLSREFNRLSSLAQQATNSAAQLQTEMMRRSTVSIQQKRVIK